MKNKIIILTLSAAATLLTAGCGRHPEEQPAPPTPTNAAPAPAAPAAPDNGSAAPAAPMAPPANPDGGGSSPTNSASTNNPAAPGQ